MKRSPIIKTQAKDEIRNCSLPLPDNKCINNSSKLSKETANNISYQPAPGHQMFYVPSALRPHWLSTLRAHRPHWLTTVQALRSHWLSTLPATDHTGYQHFQPSDDTSNQNFHPSDHTGYQHPQPSDHTG